DDDERGGGGGGIVPPRAIFEPGVPCPDDLCRATTGAAVTFVDQSTGTVAQRVWDFADGRTSRNARVDHAWSEPGFYQVSLWVSSGVHESTVAWTFLVEAADPAGTCVAGDDVRCLGDSRFAIRAEWWLADGSHGEGTVARIGTNDSALLWFFDPENWEVVIKVLDGCAVNGNVWVFGASTTNLGYRIEVTDTATGAVREYRNEAGKPAGAITDTRAFPNACTPSAPP
ncbi:MAG: PKD domain-containing protein, partial [Holophagales bacterium]|nr:PKD domain-containing protein [Holophagales bacterium]